MPTWYVLGPVRSMIADGCEVVLPGLLYMQAGHDLRPTTIIVGLVISLRLAVVLPGQRLHG